MDTYLMLIQTPNDAEIKSFNIGQCAGQLSQICKKMKAYNYEEMNDEATYLDKPMDELTSSLQYSINMPHHLDYHA